MQSPDILQFDISSISPLIKSGSISPVELTEQCLARINKINPVINAFITVTPDEALAQARQAEFEIRNEIWKGPLHGIPVALKDFFDTKGIRTTAGFAHFKNRKPTKDAAVVKKLKAAGAVIVGKTNMHELGMGTTSLVSHFGAVHNPWNLSYVAGGSSGGSAAAIAAGLCFLTIDTDAVGSCRLPASCCGVTGFKGSYGLISGEGILAGERADKTILKLAHVALTTRSAIDTIACLQVLSDDPFSELNPESIDPKEFTIGVVSNHDSIGELTDAASKAWEVFRELGFQRKKVSVPFETAVFDITNIDKERSEISATLFRDVQLLLLPTTTEPVPTVTEAQYGGPQAVSPANTFFANYFGLPAISLPAGTDHNGLPLAIQLVGAPGTDAIVLSVASKFQKHSEWHLCRPGIVTEAR